MYYDKTSILFYSKNNKLSSGTKYMQIKFLTFRDLVRQRDMAIQNIGIDKMLAD